MIVQLIAHVYAYYEYECPIYRFWINDNLYNEREFWVDCNTTYIEEEMYAELEPGEHTITIEKVKPATYAKIWIEKLVIMCNESTKELNLSVQPQDKQIVKFKIE
jgi:hypothetical protein